MQGEERHGQYLGEEGLGGRHADLQPGPREEDSVGLARGLRAHDVRDRQHMRTLLPSQAHGCQGVGGLPRLAYGYAEAVLADHRRPIAEF